MPITVLQLALFRGAEPSEDGSLSAKAIEDVDLPFMGGCLVCEATIAAYNAYPSRSGYLKCSSCIGEDGFETVEEADDAIFEL